MSRYIPTYSKLLVVSDTSMCQDKDNQYAFGPVVKELEALTTFKTIVWIGFNRGGIGQNKSLVQLKKGNIKLILLPSSGGHNVLHKAFVLLLYPLYCFVILKEVLSSKYIHVRAPSNPAVITMVLSWCFPTKKFWFKYAGNWVGEASWFYKCQRKLLKYLGANSKVTVNGNWENQSKHILAFENPCLNQTDRINGQHICEQKKMSDKINYCFVGGMNTNKGVDKIIEVLETMAKNDKFGTFHIVGGGELLEPLQLKAKTFSHKVVFHGFLAKDDICEVYEKCHYIVLPSKSEGFPKVIGEAMNYGCVPIVSDISCIGQYVQHNTNGLLIHPITTQQLQEQLMTSLFIEQKQFKTMMMYNYNLAEKFTYEYYEERIVNDIFN